MQLLRTEPRIKSENNKFSCKEHAEKEPYKNKAKIILSVFED